MINDYGISRGLVQKFKTSLFGEANAFWGFRKMFWDYLKKLHVPFYDECCADAGETELTYPVRYNATLQRLEFFNGTEWADISVIAETTTTTTTSTTTTSTTTTSSTTTTTTAP